MGNRKGKTEDGKTKHAVRLAAILSVEIVGQGRATRRKGATQPLILRSVGLSEVEKDRELPGQKLGLRNTCR